MVIIMANVSSLVTELNIDIKIVDKLKENNIVTIEKLWNLKRNDLKKMGLTDGEIKHIIIKLQLHSMDLNKKVYNKN